MPVVLGVTMTREGADLLPDLVDPGKRMHHHHLPLGSSHDVRGEDELAEALRNHIKSILSSSTRLLLMWTFSL